jgi:hypothetical protein
MLTNYVIAILLLTSDYTQYIEYLLSKTSQIQVALKVTKDSQRHLKPF